MTSRLVLAGLLVLCGGGGGGCNASSTDDGARGDDSGSGGTGGAGPSTSSTGAGAAEPGRGRGRVSVARELLADDGAASGTLHARFTTLAAAPDPCIQQIGSCTVSDCEDIRPFGVDLVSAGMLTFEGVSEERVVLSIVEGSYEATAEDGVDPLGEHGPLRFIATGDVVPAFDVELPAPASATLTSHDLADESARVQIVRGQDFTVTWSPSAGEGSVLLVLRSAGIESAVIIECTADPLAGSVTVPADVTARLQVDDAGVFAFGGLVSADHAIGDFDVTFAAADYTYTRDALIE